MKPRLTSAACFLLLWAALAGAYEDRLIDGGSLPPDVSDTYGVQDGGGWPRALRAEAVTARLGRGDTDYDESGLRLNAMVDTPDFGALTLDANLRTSSGPSLGPDSGNLVTLYQRALPMNGGWLVDNALGVTSTPAVDLARNQQRFRVPSILNNGLSTEWRGDRGVQLHASAGRPGMLNGIYVPSFEDLGGEQAGAGVQWNGSAWAAAMQAVHVDDVGVGIGPRESARSLTGHAVFGSLAWERPDARVHLNLLDSAADGRPDRLGAWIDATLRDDRVQHGFGAFRFEDGMFWGNQPLSSDHQGAYYRAAFQSRQWIADGGVDYVEPVSGLADPTIFGTGYVRYQASGRLGVGGGMNLRQGDEEAWSAFGFVDLVNAYGIGRAQADYATDPLAERAQLTLNQTWNTPAGTRLGNSVIIGQERFAGRSSGLIGLAVNGGGDLRGNFSADVNARWDHASGRERANNIHANVALNWTFAPGWSLGATWYVSRNSWRIPIGVDSPIDEPPTFEDRRSDDQGYFVTLRRQWQAGSRSAPLGGALGAGAGTIEGFLFLDENDNGLMDAGESGAPNVVILLNGRFAARTAPDGRFEFPSVAAGEHILSVVPDNLPLPWVVRDGGRTAVDVRIRERSFVVIGAHQQR